MTDDLRHLDLLDPANLDRFWRTGHFVYESGIHGDLWLALELLFADPTRTRGAAARLAERLRGRAPNVVCGPLLGGALLGQLVALELGLPFVYAEPRRDAIGQSGRYAIPSDLRLLIRGRRVVVVDDAINAGVATMTSMREIAAHEGQIVAVAALLVRSPGAIDLFREQAIPLAYLAGVAWNTWTASECPLCRAQVPIGRPSTS
jgi:orotate phosphoribosyltransferase